LRAFQAADDAAALAARGAADAVFVQTDHFLLGADDELVVDADLAELVDDDGVLLPVRLGQDAIEQRGLAGAEIAGEHRDGNFFGHHTPPCPPYIGIPAAMHPCGRRVRPARLAVSDPGLEGRRRRAGAIASGPTLPGGGPGTPGAAGRRPARTARRARRARPPPG